MADLEAAGLYDATAPDAAERLNLLRIIAARGGTVEEMVAADRAGRLHRLPGELLFLRGRERYTMDQVAKRAGVDVSVVRALWRTAGFAEVPPDDARLTDAEVQFVDVIAAASALFGEPAAMQLLRVVGASTARVADAVVSTFVTTVGASAVAADPESDALEEANTSAVEMFEQLLVVIDGLLRQHLVNSARPNVSGEVSLFETRTMAVGFVDVVGSTAFANVVPLVEIGRAISAFERLAADTVTSGNGHVVKFIGDEVMFRADDPGAACEIALSIVAGLDDHAVLADVLSDVRGAVAFGDVLVRDGDCFGPIVNLASRLCKFGARPGTVVVDEALRDAAARTSRPRLAFVELPPHELKGFGEKVCFYEARRAAGVT